MLKFTLGEVDRDYLVNEIERLKESSSASDAKVLLQQIKCLSR